jgi:hypothetical protein
MRSPLEHEKIKSAELLPLPGLAAISCYLLVLAGILIFGVMGGRHYPWLFLLIAATFIAAGIGLLRLRRWSWALALGAGSGRGFFARCLQFGEIYQPASAAHSGSRIAQPGLLSLSDPCRGAEEVAVEALGSLDFIFAMIWAQV